MQAGWREKQNPPGLPRVSLLKTAPGQPLAFDSPSSDRAAANEAVYQSDISGKYSSWYPPDGGVSRANRRGPIGGVPN